MIRWNSREEKFSKNFEKRVSNWIFYDSSDRVRGVEKKISLSLIIDRKRSNPFGDSFFYFFSSPNSLIPKLGKKKKEKDYTKQKKKFNNIWIRFLFFILFGVQFQFSSFQFSSVSVHCFVFVTERKEKHKQNTAKNQKEESRKSRKEWRI